MTKIVVTHHPFDLPAPYAARHLVGRFHASHAGDTRLRYRIPGFAALVVQAGTAASTRGRGETNAFNVLRIEPGAVTVEQQVWDGKGFMPDKQARFCKTAEGWRRA